MIVDLVVAPFLLLAKWLLGLLPEYELDVPAVDGMVERIAQINSVLPIGPVLQVAVALLGFLAVFLFIRLVLLVRHTVLP